MAARETNSDQTKTYAARVGAHDNTDTKHGVCIFDIA